MNVTEQIVTEITQRVTAGEKLEQALFITLSGYDITPKNTTLATIEDSWRQYLDMFLSRKGAAGLSKKSIKQYEYHISRFLGYYNRRVQDITEQDIYDYIRLFKECRKASNGYLSVMRRVLSSFFGWMNRKGFIEKNPVEGVDAIKTEKKVRKEFSYSELEKLRNACRNKRDRAIIEFMFSTGVRVGEIVKLKKSDISLMERKAIVYGKGAKEREVYLTETAILYLKEYLSSRNDDNEMLFVSLRGCDQITPSAVQLLYRELGQKTGISNAHPHRMRRTTATHLLNAGMPIEEVKIILGHEKMDTTLTYTVINRENVRQDHRKYMAA